MNLTEHGDESAMDVLHEIASQPKNDDDIRLVGGAGEAIARIMCRSGQFQVKYIQGLLPYKWGSALHNAIEIIEQSRADWYEKYNLKDMEKTPLIKI